MSEHQYSRLERRIEQLKKDEFETRKQRKINERKIHNQRKYSAGGLIEKVGLLDHDPNALLGALLDVREGMKDPKQVAKWRAAGGRAFEANRKKELAGTEPFILVLPGKQPKTVTDVLRSSGFRWVRELRHWVGRARYEDALALAEQFGGALHRVQTPLALPAPSESREVNGHAPAL